MGKYVYEVETDEPIEALEAGSPEGRQILDALKGATTPQRTNWGTDGVQPKPGEKRAAEPRFYGGDDLYTDVGTTDAEIAIDAEFLLEDEAAEWAQRLATEVDAAGVALAR